MQTKTKHTIKRYGLFWVGVALTIITAVLSFTPLDWFLERAIWGVSDEYYPELFWLSCGMPVALLILGAGMIWARITRPKPSSLN